MVRFCFVAIVKNEEHVMRRCLECVKNIAQTYVICDTGSTDSTVEVIRKAGEEFGMTGRVVHEPFINYAHNRSFIMAEAFKEDAEYIIWNDADDYFLNKKEEFPTKEDADDLYEWLKQQTAPFTSIMIHHNNLRYCRPLIARNDQLYVWKSPKHEYIQGTKLNGKEFYPKIYLHYTKEGAASKDPNRVRRDTKLFIDYIHEQGGPLKCPREVFYLANECSEFDVSLGIIYYKMQLEIPTAWVQERYITCLKLGMLCSSFEDKVKYYTMGQETIPHRLECLNGLVKLYNDKKMWHLALEWCFKVGDSREYKSDDLFVRSDVYDYLFDLNFSIALYYTGNYFLGNVINERNIQRNEGNSQITKLLLDNKKFFDDKIK